MRKIKVNPLTFSELQQKHYAYLLGAYLGDGYINAHPRTYRLSIYLNSNEFDIQKRIIDTFKSLIPNKVNTNRLKSKCIKIYVYSNHLPLLFPQHGEGAKHLRKIELVEWQGKIIEKFPELFITGLYDTDGSGYYSKTNPSSKYLKYNFVNTSKDIVDLFAKYVGMDVKLTLKMPKETRLKMKHILYRIQMQDKETVEKFQNIINSVYSFFESTLDTRPTKIALEKILDKSYI